MDKVTLEQIRSSGASSLFEMKFQSFVEEFMRIENEGRAGGGVAI